MLTPDENEIRKALGLLVASSSIVELRAPETHRATVSGYYDHADAFIRDAMLWSGKAPAIYLTLNPVQPDLLARAANRAREYAKTTTEDEQIICRRWLPIDFDYQRPAGISAAEEEHKAALSRAAACADWLQKECGFPSLIRADSGNGGHVLAPIDLPNDADSLALIDRCLAALAAQFNGDSVSVDLTTKNAARIWKLYGTPVCKGDEIASRPHRLAKILEVRGEVAPVELGLLLRLAALAPEKNVPRKTAPTAPRKGQPGSSPGDYTSLDVVAWFQAHGHYGRPGNEPGKHHVLCPWATSHSDTRGATASDTVIWESDGSSWPTFHCSHSHCTDRDLTSVLTLWPDVDQFCAETFTAPATWPTTSRPSGENSSARIPEHARETSLREQAGALRRQGLDADEIEASLSAINMRRCDPPLEQSSVRAIAEGVCRYEPAEATSWRVNADGKAFTGLDPLRRIDTDPPRYEACVRGKTIQLSALELMEWKRFKFACLTRLSYLPELPAPDSGDRRPSQLRWEQDFVAPAIDRTDRQSQFEQAPPDAGERGAAWQDVLAFFKAKRLGETKDDVDDDKLVRLDGHFIFRGRVLRRWLAAQKLDRLKADELYDVVRAHGGKPVNLRTEQGKQVYCWRVPDPQEGEPAEMTTNPTSQT